MSQQVRVLLVVEQLRRKVPGGIGTTVRGLLQGLRQLGAGSPVESSRGGEDVELTLYASRPTGTPDPLGRLGFPLRTSPLPGPVLTRAWQLGVADVGAGYEVVHSTSLAAPPARHSSSVVTVNDLAWREVPEAFPGRGRRWHERALEEALRRSATLVTSNDEVAQQLAEAGAPSERIRVIPFGSDHLPSPDHERAAAVLSRLGVQGEFVLAVGTLEPRKNLTRLIEAFAIARKELSGAWRLVIVGPSGWGREAAPVDGVVLAGSVDDAVLAALYERSALLAYVPLIEGFGLPPLEAMRIGTPVLASRVPSIGAAAYEVDPRSVEAMADGIVVVANDEELRKTLVSAGRARAEGFTWASTASAHVELWRSLGG